MAIGLQNNIAALRLQSALRVNNEAVSESMEKLASGLRINKASDDAAGAMLAATLNSNSKVYAQGVRNINDGLTYLAVAESAGGQLQDIIARLQELATQASNDVLTSSQRGALDSEFQSLQDEYNRIVETTEVFDRNILGESELAQGLTVQAGYGSQEALSAAFTPGADLSEMRADGTFASRVSFAMGYYSIYDVGDLNNDGKLDFTSYGTSGGNLPGVHVIIGNGDGTFQAAISYFPDSHPDSAWIADVDEDGKMDIIANRTNDVTKSVAILLGNGDGTFNAPVTHTTGTTSINFSMIGDYDGDDNVDVVEHHPVTGQVLVVLGNGDGTFKSGVSYSIQVQAYRIFSEDIDGDDDLDIVTFGTQSDARLHVLIANGNGTFNAPTSYIVGTPSTNLIGGAVGDFNGDGKKDFITGDSLGAPYLLDLVLGNGDGTFQAPLKYNMGSAYISELKPVDINEDGNLDVMAAMQIGGIYHAVALLGNGDGTFSWGASYVTNGNSLHVADFDNDGINDVLASGNPVLSFLAGQESLQTTPGTILPTISGLSIATLADAEEALADLEHHQTGIGTFLGQVGAFTSRFSSANSLARIRVENYEAAAMRITDIDVAEEVAKLVRAQILVEADNALLGQANLQSQIVLSLVK